jgi:SdrD B-like domain/Prealbumin-like fold domain
VRDAGEAGQAGVTLTISGPAGFAPRTAVSGADGAFSFTGVPFGTYTVTETVPLGFRQTAPAAPGTASAALNVSQPAVSGLLFGNQALAAPATISGTKFIDSNANGLRDPGEPGGAGVVIRLQAAAGTPVLTTTAANGSFSFAGLPPGTYTISEIVPVGFTQTAPGGAGTFTVTVAAADVRSDLLFGNRPSGPLAPGSVSGTKFLDLNQNGIVDGIDRPLEGITFVLTASDGTTLQAVSGADGTFRFDNVAPGTYVVSEVLPFNFFQTFPGTPTAPQSYTVTVQSGQNVTGFLFLNKC